MVEHTAQILLVDDYEVNLELLEAYLTLCEIPMHLYKACNGAEAYEVIEHHDLDMILLDVMLPDTTGFDICKHLKDTSRYATIPVIIITALNDKESMLKGLAAGADEFLTKPVDKYELMMRVKNLLRLRSITNDLNARYRQLHKELLLATELQKSFLPKQLPSKENLCFDVLYKPSSFIGGDFYHFFEIDANRLGILICDVKGHGVASAMITATVKFQLGSLQEDYGAPEKLLRKLNERLFAFFSNTENDFFMTAFYGVLDIHEKTFRYSNAGHSEPYRCDANGLEPLQNEMGFPLGIFSDAVFDLQTIQLYAGDMLFLYTDGIFELALHHKEAKSCASLLEFFQDEENVTIEQIEMLKQEIRDYTEQHQITDDVNYIAVRLS